MNPRTNREIVFESTLERDLVYILLTTPAVTNVRDQVGPLEYVTDDGEISKHTLDFVADLQGGASTAFGVKPSGRVEPSGIDSTLDHLRVQHPEVAQRFKTVTENDLPADRAANARLMHRAMRTRNDEDMAAVLTVANSLRGSIGIRALLSATRDDGHGFMAVACLIAEGVLEHVSTGRITYSSFVRPRRTTSTKY